MIQGISITTSDSNNPFGWGEDWTFTVTLYDEDQATFNFEKMNISLWYYKDGVWKLLNTTVCSAPACKVSTDISFYRTFTCDDIGTWQFNFTATDYWNYTTIYSFNQQIIKDDVQLYITSSPSSVAREGTTSALLQVRVSDYDKGVYVGAGVNGSFEVTYDGTNYAPPYYTTTDASGYLSYHFDPDCTYSVGEQVWRAKVESDACYSSTYLGAVSAFITIYGQLKNNLYLPGHGSVFNVTDSVLIRFNVSSDCIDEGLIANASTSVELIAPSGSIFVCEPVLNETGANAGWYNCTWDSTDMEEGYWDVRLNSSKEYFLDNSTTYFDWFWLENVPTKAENVTVWIYNYTSNRWEEANLSLSYGWSRKFNFTIDVYDQEGDDITCVLWIKLNSSNSWIIAGSDEISGSAGVPTEGTCSVVFHGFGCGDIGVNDFLWEIRDKESANWWNTSVESLELRETEVNITLVEGDGSFVNRTTGSVPLRVRIFDRENNTYAVANVSFWVSHDNSNLQFDTLVLSSTNGIATYNFAPDCSYTVGVQYWKAGVTDACYIDVNSSLYTTTVIGWLRNDILSPDGEEYRRIGPDGVSDNVTIRVHVYDECGNNVSVDYINFTSKHVDSGQRFYCSPILDEGSGYYNCTFNVSSPVLMPTRWYDVISYVNKSYFNSNSTIKSNAFWVETQPLLFAPQVNSEQGGNVGGWGEDWNFTVNVTDEDLDSVTVYLWIRKIGGSWIYKGSKTTQGINKRVTFVIYNPCLLYTSPSPRDLSTSRMPSSA